MPSSTSSPTNRHETIATFLRLWPLHLLLLCALYVLGGPAWRMARMAFADGSEGGVQVDTAGASGRQAGGRYVVDLPLDVINRSPDMVMGVSLWVETFGCPDRDAPTSACRKLTAFEQYAPLRIAPGSATSLSQRMTAVAPRDGEVIRITRKLQAIEGERPAS